MAHQTTEEHAVHRWHRTAELMEMAIESRMGNAQIGKENLEAALQAGMKYVLKVRRKDFEANEKILDKLWEMLGIVVKGKLGAVSLELRKVWLKYCLKRAQKSLDGKASLQCALLELNDRGGIEGIEDEVGRVLQKFGGRHDSTTEERSRVALRLLVWCWNTRIDVPEASAVSIINTMRLLEEASTDQSTNPGRYRVEVERFFHNSSTETFERLKRCLARVTDMSLSRGEVFSHHSISETNSSNLLSQSFRIIQRLDAEGNPGKALDAVLEIWTRTLRKQEADCDRHLTMMLSFAQRLVFAPGVIEKSLKASFIERLARCVLELALPSLSPSSLQRLFTLLLHLDWSAESYHLIRKYYPLARSASTPYRWTDSSRTAWTRIFLHSCSPDVHHLQFASRLYADLLADGLDITRTEAVAIIRCIGTRKSASRGILLERHIKDYLWTGSPDGPLVMALTEGLTRSKDPRDALLALNLSRRILRERSIPTLALERIIRGLVRFPERYFLTRAFDLLQSPDHDLSLDTYIYILRRFAAHGRLHPSPAQLSVEESLAYVVRISLDLSKKAPPNAQIYSIIIRALSKAKQLPIAMAIFNKSIEEGIRLRSDAVGQLMTNLVVKDELDQAEDVETRWRAMVMGEGFDRGVVGARVLLDMKRGNKVDFDKLKRKGWSPTPGFWGLLKSIDPSIQIRAEQASIVQEASMVEKEEVEEAVAGCPIEGRESIKERIKPLTRSLWEGTGHEGREASWEVDR
ncbi:hypothetical protein P7C73_g4941, partial [Tremellales sp. Uapishka_1]